MELSFWTAGTVDRVRLVERGLIAFGKQILSPFNLYSTMKDRRRFRVSKYACVEQHAAGLALLLAMFLAANCISLASIEHSVGTEHEHVFDALAGILLVAGLIPLSSWHGSASVILPELAVAVCDGDAARRTQQHDQGTPVGSNR
jgi:hypothetical protein